MATSHAPAIAPDNVDAWRPALRAAGLASVQKLAEGYCASQIEANPKKCQKDDTGPDHAPTPFGWYGRYRLSGQIRTRHSWTSSLVCSPQDRHIILKTPRFPAFPRAQSTYKRRYLGFVCFRASTISSYSSRIGNAFKASRASAIVMDGFRCFFCSATIRSPVRMVTLPLQKHTGCYFQHFQARPYGYPPIAADLCISCRLRASCRASSLSPHPMLCQDKSLQLRCRDQEPGLAGLPHLHSFDQAPAYPAAHGYFRPPSEDGKLGNCQHRSIFVHAYMIPDDTGCVKRGNGIPAKKVAKIVASLGRFETWGGERK